MFIRKRTLQRLLQFYYQVGYTQAWLNRDALERKVQEPNFQVKPDFLNTQRRRSADQ